MKNVNGQTIMTEPMAGEGYNRKPRDDNIEEP